MKTLLACCALLSLAAIAIAVLAITGPTPPPPADADARAQASAAAARAAAAEARCAALEQRLGAMAEQVERLQAAPAPAPATVPAVAPTADIALDDERLRRMVRAELDTSMQRLRADRAAGPGGRATGSIDELATLQERLGIDHDTALRVAAATEALRERARDIWRRNPDGDREANLALLQAERAKTDAELSALLTTEQLARYQEWVERTLQARRDRGLRGDRPQRPAAPAAPAAPAPPAVAPGATF